MENFECSGDCDCSKEKNNELENLNTFGHMYLMVTHDCNFACEYCFNHVEGSIIPLETAKKAVDILVKHKPPQQNNLNVTFFGGEPLLGIDIIKSVKKYCRETYPNIQWSYNITTNLSILNKIIYEEIILDPSVHVMVSLDGPKEINKRRIWKQSKEETFDFVVDNIKQTMVNPVFGFTFADGIKKLSKRFIIRATFDTTPESIASLYERFCFLVDNFGSNFVLMQVDESDWTKVDYQIYKNQIFKILGKIESLQNKELYSSIKFFKDSMDSFTVNFLGLPNKMNKSCGQAFGQFAVDYTGKLSPCHRFTNIYLDGCSDYVIGDVDTGLDLEAIKRLRALDSMTLNRCEARNCKRRGVCAFGCFASGVACSDTFAPQCNGQDNVLFSLFEYNNNIIEDIFYNAEQLPTFRTVLGISTEQKANALFSKLKELSVQHTNLQKTVQKMTEYMDLVQLQLESKPNVD